MGAGKPGFGATLAERRGVVRLCPDEWMMALFAPDRPASDLVPWYQARATSTQVNVHEAQTTLSQLLERAHAGEEIIIAKNGKPFARLMPLLRLV